MESSRIAGDYFASGVPTAIACRPTRVCQERGIVVSEWRVGVSDVGILVSRIFDSSRDGALVVVSPASDTNRPRIDTKVLAQRLPPGTELAVLDSMTASERLSDTVDPQFQVYGGGIRVILAGAARTDHWRRHRLFRVYPGDDADSACLDIAEHVASHQGIGRPRQSGSGSTPQKALSDDQMAALDRFRASLDVTSSALAPAKRVPRPGPGHTPNPKPGSMVPKPGPHRPASTSSSSTAHTPPAPAVTGLSATELKNLLDTQTERIANKLRSSIIDDLMLLLDSDHESLARERSRADAAEEELDHLRRRMTDQEESRGYPRVYSDPEKQFRWEVEYEWLTGNPEEERGESLTPYTIGEGFLDSMEAELLRGRAKIVQVIVDVLSGHAWDRRKTHQFIIPGKSVIQKTIPEGAVPWRTYVKRGAPGAARLTWWQYPDGTIELVHVGHHDDLLR